MKLHVVNKAHEISEEATVLGLHFVRAIRGMHKYKI
jgi:hypothetical protein